ncbi:MAG: sigma-70 family RNA polymerase sigma factor, partial [Victivallales bacterium]|nr:sigma-70 family RNA polymerase sigma factor [Victivallales bacterium]
MKIAAKPEKLLAANNLKAYLYRMAANLAYDRIKARKRQEIKVVDYSLILEAKAEDCTSHEQITELGYALDRLPPEEKEIVVLKNFMDKTFREIADSVNVSVNTVAGRYRGALRKLKVILEEKL